MPTYSYECDCGQEQTVCQPISERKAPVCLNCEKDMLRIFVAPQVRRETFSHGRSISSLPSITGKPGAKDVLQTRGDYKEWTRRYNAKQSDPQKHIVSCYEEK